MEYAYPSQYPEYVQEQFNSVPCFPEPSYNCYSNSYNSGWQKHSNFTWTQQVPDPYYAPYPKPHISNTSDPWAYYPTSQQEPYQHLAPTPSQNYSLDFQVKMLQTLNEFEANTQVYTQLLHSQTQSFSKIETYADQIGIAISKWDEKILSNNEQLVDTEYMGDAWDVGKSLTNSKDPRVEELSSKGSDVDSSPPFLSSTSETMSNFQLEALQHDSMYVPLGPVETFSMVTPLHVSQTDREEEKIVSLLASEGIELGHDFPNSAAHDTFDIDKHSPNDEEVSNVCMISSLVNNAFNNSSSDDSLETNLAHCGYDFEHDELSEQASSLLDSAPWSTIDEWISKGEPLHPSALSPLPFAIGSPDCELELSSPDPSVELLGPVEIMSVVICPHSDQSIKERIIGDNGPSFKESVCDFIIEAASFGSTHRILLGVVLFKKTFPWMCAGVGVGERFLLLVRSHASLPPGRAPASESESATRGSLLLVRSRVPSSVPFTSSHLRLPPLGMLKSLLFAFTKPDEDLSPAHGDESNFLLGLWLNQFELNRLSKSYIRTRIKICISADSHHQCEPGSTTAADLAMWKQAEASRDARKCICFMLVSLYNIVPSIQTSCRSNLVSLVRLLKRKKFTPLQVREIKKTPFANLLLAMTKPEINELFVKKSSEITLKLVEKYKGEGYFDLGGKLVKISAKDLTLIFGIKSRPNKIHLQGNPRRPILDFPDRVFKIEKEMLVSRMKIFLKKAFTEDSSENAQDIARVLMMLVLATIFVPLSQPKLSWAYCPLIEDHNTSTTYAWSTFITKHLVKELDTKRTNPTTVGGCVLGLLYWLCEHTSIMNMRQSKDNCPRFMKWDMNDLPEALARTLLESLNPEMVKDAELEPNNEKEKKLLHFLKQIENESDVKDDDTQECSLDHDGSKSEKDEGVEATNNDTNNLISNLLKKN
ncbi:hypothetical protein RHGRI_033446 [Rhododendron griersonianum]|uniref:Uncharacterized protein n=1 Tax=Rhododendron griersonianum TaxID=479676 RepID=A0AAV6HZX9_9ERIC|nr:hypothetical protein RHGRI_033446 [Rhododendron griersonianum]